MNSLIYISPKELPTSVVAPTSKSYINRALICSSLNEKRCEISHVNLCQDVLDLVKCLQEIGLVIKVQNDKLIIENSFPACELNKNEPLCLKTGEGGTTNRFLLTLLAMGEREYHLNCAQDFLKRPNQELISSLQELGAKIKIEDTMIIIQGPIEKKSVSIDCSKSTQFASSLKLCGIPVSLKNVSSSENYLAMTDSVVEYFRREQNYVSPIDFSGLSYIAAYACLNQTMQIVNCKELDLFQGDSKFLEIMKSMGGDYIFDKSGLRIFKSKTLKGIDVNCKDCLDIVPTLAYLASVAEGISCFRGIENLRYKESNRIEAIINTLNFFNIKAYIQGDSTLCVAGGKLKKMDDSYSQVNDHRMFFLATLLFKHVGGGNLGPVDSAKKSYPDFISLFC